MGTFSRLCSPKYEHNQPIGEFERRKLRLKNVLAAGVLRRDRLTTPHSNFNSKIYRFNSKTYRGDRHWGPTQNNSRFCLVSRADRVGFGGELGSGCSRLSRRRPRGLAGSYRGRRCSRMDTDVLHARPLPPQRPRTATRPFYRNVEIPLEHSAVAALNPSSARFHSVGGNREGESRLPAEADHGHTDGMRHFQTLSPRRGSASILTLSH